MTKNPILNAFGALGYIGVISIVMFYGGKIEEPATPILAPLAVLSLFTLSAAAMAYIFGYQPFVMYFDNKKKQAVKLFLQTVGVFGAITFLLLILLFSRIIS